jgi:hypothetical protein
MVPPTNTCNVQSTLKLPKTARSRVAPTPATRDVLSNLPCPLQAFSTGFLDDQIYSATSTPSTPPPWPGRCSLPRTTPAVRLPEPTTASRRLGACSTCMGAGTTVVYIQAGIQAGLRFQKSYLSAWGLRHPGQRVGNRRHQVYLSFVVW